MYLHEHYPQVSLTSRWVKHHLCQSDSQLPAHWQSVHRQSPLLQAMSVASWLCLHISGSWEGLHCPYLQWSAGSRRTHSTSQAHVGHKDTHTTNWHSLLTTSMACFFWVHFAQDGSVPQSVRAAREPRLRADSRVTSSQMTERFCTYLSMS